VSEGPRPEIERALGFIGDHLDRPISVAQVARAAHLSPFHLHRVFHAAVGESIGREAARLLARRGHRIVRAARDTAALHALARDIEGEGGRAEVLPLDLTDAASIDRAAAALLAAGPCDVLVNNAGACHQGEFLAQPPTTQRAEMELNYWGALRLTRALLPAFIGRRAGAIVNVSSLLGSVASPTTACYGASKAALEAWTLALRAEVARFGVRVCLFVAPHTDTETGRRVKFDGVISVPVAYTARQLAHAVDRACRPGSRAPRKHIASPVYRLLLWLARVFPAFIEARVGASARALRPHDPPGAAG
jgi:short-subunit dehydrogenase